MVRSPGRRSANCSRATRRASSAAPHAPHGKFPLLLKFIDARQELSVQVHPNDEQAAKLGPGQFGKTEAWVILDRCAETSQIYAGFAEGVTADHFRAALAEKTTPRTLHSFTPEPGDCVFLEAGTVHAIGANILLFEVQQTSDITYRLYDWDRVDAKTGQPRQLHIEDGLACADFARGPCPPVAPTVAEGEGRAPRRAGELPVLHPGAEDEPRAVPRRGEGRVPRGRVRRRLGRDRVAREATTRSRPATRCLLPAEVGECVCRPDARDRGAGMWVAGGSGTRMTRMQDRMNRIRIELISLRSSVIRVLLRVIRVQLSLHRRFCTKVLHANRPERGPG